MTIPTCQDRSGFLFAHGCDRAPDYTCVACGHAICDYHARDGADGQVYCVTCLLARDQQAYLASNKAADDPFAYRARAGMAAGYYDASDFAAFDEEDDSAGGGANDPALGVS